MSRAMGETASIMFTAATFYTLQLPGSSWQEVMTLSYHLYVLATAGTHIDQPRPLQFSTMLVLITLMLGISLTAIVTKSRIRKGKK